jgi:diguanylate cyclase (GGDEF)-like protein
MTEKNKFPTLLLISDNPSIHHWIKKHLENRFFIIDAPTKQIAIEIAQSTALDFIILDSFFEDCDSLELASQLRQINLSIPIFLMTGRLKKSFRDDALDSGVTDFLNDQLTVEELETRFAAGKKTAAMRKKTSEISFQIKSPEQTLAVDFFKNKLLLNQKALLLFDEVKKKKESITLLLVRIDHFDELPTREFLSPLQERLNACLQAEDLLLSAPNGIFIILLPHTSIKDAHDIAEQLRKSVQQKPFDIPKHSLNLTISIAVSPLEANESQYKKTVALANQALNEQQNATNSIISIDKR